MYNTKSVIEFETEARDLEEAGRVDWSDLIFAPFHPVFKLFVLFSVIVKTVLGPLRSVYPTIFCLDMEDMHPFLSFLKYFYLYGCDSIYGIDTFLHIVHRRVTDKAMRREYLPKSAFLILLDLLSLIPFYRMMATENCPVAQLWPNIMGFNEFLIIYRGVEYFSLITTHCCWKICIGFTIILAICTNCVTCFWLLLTYQGLCNNCEHGNYDWRSYIQHKLNETNVNFTTYVYAATFLNTFTVSKAFDEIKPHTILEFQMTCLLIIFGFLLKMYIIYPKAFAESSLRLRSICERYPDVKKIIEEARRRNASHKSCEQLENFYFLMWQKRSGIANMPEIVADFPRYLRLDIKQDLVWQFFYHSPTLRKTSDPFKRGLYDLIKLDYRLPSENFYTKPHCLSNLYYLKSGVVQLISNDDGMTPIISLSGGTVLGDVCFLIPPMKMKITTRCLTYCEIIYITGKDLLKTMNRYPKDRALIIKSTKERLEHAKTLYTCKLYIRGLDRTEDEGVSWIIRRWWEIFTAIHNWEKKSRNAKNYLKFVLPPEEHIYHCAKYIGQLVLCTEGQLQTKSMFINTKFPWILTPDSKFGMVWHRVVIATVFLALITYPPNLTNVSIPEWFRFVQYWTNFIYTADIFVSLSSCLQEQENDVVNFFTVMFARCKSYEFILDVLSAIWTENVAVIIGIPDYYYTVQFNRLIKTYLLFTGKYTRMNIRQDPVANVNYNINLIHFCVLYVISYLLYEVDKRVPDITRSFFFGARHCKSGSLSECDPAELSTIGVFISWVFETLFCEYLPFKLIDIYFANLLGYFHFMVFTFSKMTLVACLYLRYRDVINYQHLVSNVKKYYVHHKIHHDLLKRLERYLICHWKYYKGKDVMYPNILRNEPYDVFWRVQGEVAEKLISESKAFVGADPALIRELANAAQFMILPKKSTIFTIGTQCKNVTWVVQGCVQCEYHDENGEILKVFYEAGQMLSVSSVFLGKASLKTYTSYTECEILYIKIQEFFTIIKRHPSEWTYYETCINEIGPEFEDMFHKYILKHRDYQHKLRDTMHSTRMSEKAAPATRMVSERIDNDYRSSPLEGVFWGEPESKFMRCWLIFRAITVCVTIICSSIQGGIGANHRWPLMMICAFCSCIAWTDIVLKLFLAYYDKRGLLITDKRMCLKNYLIRGFLFDILGAIPMNQILCAAMSQSIREDIGQLINTFCKFCHLYIVCECFNYVGDTVTVNMSLLMILKWQVIIILLLFGESHFLMIFCINYKYDDQWNLISMQKLNSCWIPKFIRMEKEFLTLDDLHLLFIESFNLAQSGLMSINVGRFYIDRDNLAIGSSLMILGIIWWYVFCYTLTLLVLNSRSSTLFQHGIRQLQRFLEGERVDKELIHRTLLYFRYSWTRTKGVNINQLTYERVGVVFRQDLSYYFYRRTFLALDTVLEAEEIVIRQLASACTQVYFMPGQDIIRKMDISPVVYIVHRGKVLITKNGDRIITLSKGCIFGQLEGIKTRPIRVTSTAEEYVDLLQIPIKQFQDIITDQVRNTIAISNQAKYDFMAVKKFFPENPYETVEYILRGRRAIQLPWMRTPIKFRTKSWYYRWLFLTWLVEPFCSSVIVILLGTLPAYYIKKLYWVLGVFDIIHLGSIISEFYTVQLRIEDNKCVNRIAGRSHFKSWGLYIDMVSLVTPIVTVFTGNWVYQIARLLRLRLLYQFEVNFCRSFESVSAGTIMKFLIVCLILHTFTCGWIYVACRHEKTPVAFPAFTAELNKTIDYDQWAMPKDRKGGCYRLTKNFRTADGDFLPNFVVPKNWQQDYVIALTYVLMICSHINLETAVCLSTNEVYFKVVMTFFIYLIDIWVVSIALTAVYTKYRELYQYDYNLNNLTTYLAHSGLAPVLTKSVIEYTKQLWNRQRGNWLPELVNFAPACLREDMFASLYMYHLDLPYIFHNVPTYFKRQMAARFKRVVIFPGKWIVREGDIFACMYFIHEGEVEKWFLDSDGEQKLQSLLYTNGYFGIIPGLTLAPFNFSYYTRTVVDLVYLKLIEWQDLLDSYPNIKSELFKTAEEIKKELIRQKYGKSLTSQMTMGPSLQKGK